MKLIGWKTSWAASICGYIAHTEYPLCKGERKSARPRNLLFYSRAQWTTTATTTLSTNSRTSTGISTNPNTSSVIAQANLLRSVVPNTANATLETIDSGVLRAFIKS